MTSRGSTRESAKFGCWAVVVPFAVFAASRETRSPPVLKTHAGGRGGDIGFWVLDGKEQWHASIRRLIVDPALGRPPHQRPALTTTIATLIADPKRR